MNQSYLEILRASPIADVFPNCFKSIAAIVYIENNAKPTKRVVYSELGDRGLLFLRL